MAVPKGQGEEQARAIIVWLRDHRGDFHPTFFEEHEAILDCIDLDVTKYPTQANAFYKKRLAHLMGIWSGAHLVDVLEAANSCLKDLFVSWAKDDDEPNECPGCSCDQYFKYMFSTTQDKIVIYCELCGTGIGSSGESLDDALRIPTTEEVETTLSKGPKGLWNKLFR